MNNQQSIIETYIKLNEKQKDWNYNENLKLLEAYENQPSRRFFLPVLIWPYKNPKCEYCDDNRKITVTAPNGQKLSAYCKCSEQEEKPCWILTRNCHPDLIYRKGRLQMVVGRSTDDFSNDIYRNVDYHLGAFNFRLKEWFRPVTLDPIAMKPPMKSEIKTRTKLTYRQQEADKYNRTMITNCIFSSWKLFETFCSEADLPFISEQQVKTLITDTDRRKYGLE